MIGMKVQTIDQSRNVIAAANRASFENLGHAAAVIRKTAMLSIKTSPKPSKVGKPPHTRRGKIRRAIVYAVSKDKLDAIIGPMASRVGTAGEAHEFGGEYKGQQFPERPFMGPALEKERDRLPSYWRGTVGR